jgi:hypothetical protein
MYLNGDSELIELIDLYGLLALSKPKTITCITYINVNLELRILIINKAPKLTFPN